MVNIIDKVSFLRFGYNKKDVMDVIVKATKIISSIHLIVSSVLKLLWACWAARITTPAEQWHKASAKLSTEYPEVKKNGAQKKIGKTSVWFHISHSEKSTLLRTNKGSLCIVSMYSSLGRQSVLQKLLLITESWLRNVCFFQCKMIL